MVTENAVTLPTRAWHGDADLTLRFPSGWQLEVLGPREVPRLSEAEIQAAFAAPIGTATIAELARGRHSAAIVVDDLSRPTPAAAVIPTLLRELDRAGIPRSEIRFVVGGGSHRPISKAEIAQKVGPAVAAEYAVTNHDFMRGDLRGLGCLPNGMPIYIDPVVADADFKICLGGIYPHGAVGFGGGSKLIVPGVAGFATMFYFHTFSASRGHAVVENRNGQLDHRDVSEAVAGVVGLDAVVNVVINSRRQVAGVFVGDYVRAQRAGAYFARQVYGTQIPDELRRDVDLVVTNCYPLDSDALQTTKALWMRRYFEDAYYVAVNPACDGICFHGLFNRIDWARFQQQKAEKQVMLDPVPQIEDRDQLLVWSQNFPADDFVEKVRRGVLYRSWQTLIEQLAPLLPENARVAVFPCGSIQVLSDADVVPDESVEQVGERVPAVAPSD